MRNATIQPAPRSDFVYADRVLTHGAPFAAVATWGRLRVVDCSWPGHAYTDPRAWAPSAEYVPEVTSTMDAVLREGDVVVVPCPVSWRGEAVARQVEQVAVRRSNARPLGKEGD